MTINFNQSHFLTELPKIATSLSPLTGTCTMSFWGERIVKVNDQSILLDDLPQKIYATSLLCFNENNLSLESRKAGLVL